MQPRYEPALLSECKNFAKLHPMCDVHQTLFYEAGCVTHDHAAVPAGVPDHEQGGA
jgi:hypothetical protein